MSGLLEMVTGMMGGDALSGLSKSLGADESSTQKALGAALPMLVSALAKNSQEENGASALSNALDKDHDGSILDNLGGFLQGGDTSMGSSILKHILGGKQDLASQGVSALSGLSKESSGKLFSMLAPILMGQLGKAKKENGLDASGLSQMLGMAKDEVAQKSPDQMGFIGKMLDADGDGNVMDDIMGGLGKKLLGGLFNKK